MNGRQEGDGFVNMKERCSLVLIGLYRTDDIQDEVNQINQLWKVSIDIKTTTNV